MKLLVTSTPGLGHVNPLIPLAQAFARNGHEVRWAAGADAGPRIEAAGLTAIGAGRTSAERHTEYRRRYPEWEDLQPQDLPAHMFPRLFGDVSMPPMLDDLMSVVRDWPPDVILHEVGEFAAPIVAGVLGIPHVTQGFGARLRPERLAALTDFVAPYWRDAGLEPRARAGSYDYLYLDIYPPSLDPGYDDDIPTRGLLRPVAIDEPESSDVTDWLVADTDRPLLYLTFGTVFNATAGAFGATVQALRELDVRALVTVGARGDVNAFGTLPERIRVEHYVPQYVTLRYCTAVVSHGGSGTLLATLARGLPQLCLPQAADQFVNAAACARVGAGIDIAPQAADSSTIAAAISRLLSATEYREGAQRIAGEIAAMPSPDEVASTIESRFGPE